MKKLRRLAALFLCVLLMISSQGIAILAETEGQFTDIPMEAGIEVKEPEAVKRISETLPLEMIEAAEEETPRVDETLTLDPVEKTEAAEEETTRIEETLALEPVKKNTPDEGIIYWNPGGVLPEDLATASNAQTATASNVRTASASNARKGSDNADGRTPSTPVKTLAKALERAEELIEEEGFLPADITIYAMNPMEVADGQLYVLNGGNLNIKSWPGRSYNSDVIFYVNGGQLTMMNARLASGNPECPDDEAQLIYVRGGAFQMGQNVNLEGRVVLDYRRGTEGTVWETATASDAKAGATASDAKAGTDTVDSAMADTKGGEVSFDLSEYIVDSDEGSMEVLEDSVSASTWREPIIELVEGFDGGAGEYLLELLTEGSAKEIALVKTLYNDAETEEEFLGFFTLAENMDASWSLQVETQMAAQVRNTDLLSTFSVTGILTSKTLIAARGASSREIYWNPGGDIVMGGVTYYAGDDEFAGTAMFPVKTWERAVARAEGGIIICMQTLDLGDSDANDYLLTVDGMNYLLKSSSTATMAALSAWESNPQPVVRVPAGKTLVLQDVKLVGVRGTSAPMIACDKGDLIIEENVTAAIGYIQVKAFKGMENHPIKVTSTDAADDGDFALFFDGINNSFEYCYADMVVPYGALAAGITAAGDADAVAAKKISVGLALYDRVKLHPSHRDEVNGGTSEYDWSLRPDQADDNDGLNPQNLELYATPYFDAIYLDGENGNDAYYGVDCQYPVKTWARAQARWAEEMEKSVTARRVAAAAPSGKTPEEIESLYPLPKTIYICGTVTAAGGQSWDLGAALAAEYHLDYDNVSVIKKTEVVPHSVNLKHATPTTLVKVASGGDLKIKDIAFRNMTDDRNSVTLQVASGGKLTLLGATSMTGERLAEGNITAKDVTLGTHVEVLAGGSFSMGSAGDTWSGSIEKRQHGVKASGSGAAVTMYGGSIRENSSLEQDLYDTGETGHQPGAGVLLSGGAAFIMNGGEIAENTVYQYGAGVYMVGTGTSFTMNKGKIWRNKMYSQNISQTNTTSLRGYGIGIYAGTGTELTLGNGSTAAADVLVGNNIGYLTSGVGVYSDGALKINQATISENFANGFTGTSSANINYGLGIYVGSNATLSMTGGQVSKNTGFSGTGRVYGRTQGAGIYITSSSSAKSHTITGSTISENSVGNMGSTDSNYSRGGGIYIYDTVGSSLTIGGNSIISNNAALYGGGIFIYGIASTRVTIANTTIQKNAAQDKSSGNAFGGGVYFSGNGSWYLNDGVKIIGNFASQYGGGIYLTGSTSTHLYMKATKMGDIVIDDNEAGVSNTSVTVAGGGIYQISSTIIHAQNVQINNNKVNGSSSLWGGGIYAAGTGYFKTVTIGSGARGNKAGSGGGLYLAGGGLYYMNDCTVSANQATDGGGIYQASGKLHLTETANGKFVLSENHADNGGGIYVAATNNFLMNIAGEIQNSAAVQGSNLYLGMAGAIASSNTTANQAFILAGKFKQPVAEKRVDTVYNIYVNDTSVLSGSGSNSIAHTCFDMSTVTVEKQSDENPKVIYLNTTTSNLNYLAAPPNNTTATFPIDLNTEVFNAGSVVVKPWITSTSGTSSPVEVLSPNAALDGTVSTVKSYSLRNASTNLSYFSGGKRPTGTELMGFVTAGSGASAVTNVILSGNGIYLSGAGSDSNDGLSPTKPVKTFAVAKTKLATLITANSGVEGFQPCIYICGQVTVTGSEAAWELTYEGAQVRRFATFVDSPMILVSSGSFSMGEIVINGMADAVNVMDQGSRSPVISGAAGSKVILNEKSQITNNYYSGVDIYGDLLLTGTSGDSEKYNKQLNNHQGSFVRLYANSKMTMEGSSRILADSNKKIGAISGHGIEIMAAGVQVSMLGGSSIEQKSAASLLNGSGIYMGSSSSASITMSEQASIISQPGLSDGMEYGVYLRGAGSQMKMQGDAKIAMAGYSSVSPGRSGIYVNTTGTGSVAMEGNAKITMSGFSSSSYTHGIYVAGSNTVVTMQGKAGIAMATTVSTAASLTNSRGVCVSGTNNKVIMQGNSFIRNEGAVSGNHTGIYMYNATTPTVEMLNNAAIDGNTGDTGYGIYVWATNAAISMNMGGTAEDPGGSAGITHTGSGIFLDQSTNGCTISMGKGARISDSDYGIDFGVTTNVNPYLISMEGNSRISGNTKSGVYFNAYGAITVPVEIKMKGSAAIEQNGSNGIHEDNYSWAYPGVTKFSLDMEDSARISGNAGYGLYLNGHRSFTEADGYHKITLKGSAIIGGVGYYDDAAADSGNKYSGIYASSPLQLTMNDDSRISGNGTFDPADILVGAEDLAEADSSPRADTPPASVYLTRRTGNYYCSGMSKITLNENASICDNKGGVYVKSSTAEEYPDTCEIVLNGISATGVLSSPSIQRNGEAVFLGNDGTLRLQGKAILGSATAHVDPLTPADSLDCYGALLLDGRSTIEGLVHLRDGLKPITMTHEVPSALPQEYKLHLAEGYLGQIVVKPGADSAGNSMADVTGQIDYFNKVSADGVAAYSDILANYPNLVLGGVNHVFLSGEGSDNNKGNSRSTPVRTFKRAKELLETETYFTAGANIIICNSTVSVQAGDGAWSFGSGGYVTNTNTNQTWKPLVIRDELFTGVLISVNGGAGYADTVTFKDIAIDGGAEQVPEMILTGISDNQLMTVGSGATAILKEGAVLQNNKASSSDGNTAETTANTLGVYVNGGTLEIDGGTIQRMVREVTASTTVSHYLSSAVYCSGTASRPGKVIMKSGQIIENQLLDVNASGTDGRYGTIYLNSAYANMEMSGGAITGNTVSRKVASAAGTIVNYRGMLTMSGGTIRENQGGYGSAIYHYGDAIGGELILSGGEISGNRIDIVGQSYASKGEYSPIYVANYGLQLKVGAAGLSDPVYLASSNGIIRVSGQNYQTDRRYRIYLNQETGIKAFRSGSVVVQPDGVHTTDATPYLSYFDIRTSPYVLDAGRSDQMAGMNQSAVTIAGMRENQCLILMKAVYLDSVNGSDLNDGLTPAKAVGTFAGARDLGAASDSNGSTDSCKHYIIYVSGKVFNMAAETWSLPDTAYMCRYTGFTVYTDISGTPAKETNLAYYGPLIEPDAALTLQDIAIYGRRVADTVSNNGDSLVRIKSGIQVIVEAGAFLADNYNMGNYFNTEDGELENLTSRGGAFHVAAGGKLRIDGGVIRNTEATYGSAIYLGVSETNLGQLFLTGSPALSGKVYLDGIGTAEATSAYITVAADYQPDATVNGILQVSIGNAYSGRQIIRYPADFVPGVDETKYYLFDDAIQAMYDVVNRASPYEYILELNMRRAIYLDGQNGSDSVSNDGSTPEKAYKTLKKVFESIGKDEDTYGTVVFVVNTIEVQGTGGGPAEIEMMNILMEEDGGNSHYEGYYRENGGEKIPFRGQVVFKRYAQPKGYSAESPDIYEGFEKETLFDTLFCVKNGGILKMGGICLDGHSQDSDNSNLTMVADGVKAKSPLVTVEGGGELHCLSVDTLKIPNGVSVTTLFTNNFNVYEKDKTIGVFNSSVIKEGSSAGIELLDGGKCFLDCTEFSNLQLGEKVITRGTDVYSNGELHLLTDNDFGGTVYLEGFWNANDKTNPVPSRYINVDVYGRPVKTNFQVLMRDPYAGRIVVHYPIKVGIEPGSTDIGYYRLEERVKDFFCLNKRAGAEYIFELQVPTAVYIDGASGVDDLDDRAAGSTPKKPVRTLKRAFELLSTRGGNTIYVVDTVQLSSDIEVTGMSYRGTDGIVLLGSTSKVNITRYLQPDFVTETPLDPDVSSYSVPDFTGVLLNVTNGVTAGFGNGVCFDGHSEAKNNTTDVTYAKEAIVDRSGKGGEAKAPLITVASGGILNLSDGTTLQNNNNTYADDDALGQDGGAISNSGTVNVNGSLFENNKAGKGSVVYQDGIFTIQSKPENLSNHANAFYLTTPKSGSEDSPVWGTDHVIRTAVAIPGDMIGNLAFDVDMDHPVKGRPVVRFINSSAYSPDADAEHEHFKLGSNVRNVRPELFLVGSETEQDLLELQNWEILKVKVPTDIYLVMSRMGTGAASASLSGIMADAPVGNLLTAPEYKIENSGNYDVKVSINGFENQTQSEGIDVITYPLMNLTESAGDALGRSDLYLAVKGLDDTAATGFGFGMAETSLKPYTDDLVPADPAVLGTLKKETSGKFTFIGAVGEGFMSQYMDSGFPLEGTTGAAAQKYMDGTSTGVIHARAKYLLRYKVEIDPSRR